MEPGNGGLAPAGDKLQGGHTAAKIMVLESDPHPLMIKS